MGITVALANKNGNTGDKFWRMDMKKALPEMGKTPRIQSINDYIEKELCEIKVAAEEITEQTVEWDDLNKLFLRMVVSK